MADGTHIEWTDATWQIVTGCTVVSPGCTNCYAMKLAGTRLQHHPSRKGLTIKTKAGPFWNGKIRFNKEWLSQPLNWKRPRRIFVAAHGDLFHEGVSRLMLVDIFAVMAMADWHTFQVLTKRSTRMREFMAWLATAEGQLAMMHAIKKLGINRFYTLPLPNVWLGVSVEDQSRAEERIPDLLNTAAAVRWISAEPLLGAVNIRQISLGGGVTLDALTGHHSCGIGTLPGETVQQTISRLPNLPTAIDFLNWIVVGGESGPKSRPMHPEWERTIREQCKAAGVSYFRKQWGDWIRWEPRYSADVDYFGEDGTSSTNPGLAREPMVRVGKKTAGALLHGELHQQWPK